MQRLNKVRVALKRHETLPSSPDTEAFRVRVTSFLEGNTSLVFGVECRQTVFMLRGSALEVSCGYM